MAAALAATLVVVLVAAASASAQGGAPAPDPPAEPAAGAITGTIDPTIDPSIDPALIDPAEAEALRRAVEEAARIERQRRRSEAEVERLSDTIRLTEERQRELEAAVAAISDDAAALRARAVEAAEQRERATGAISRAAERLAVLGAREEALLADLAARRDVLADVLGALQRMGGNPPPALVVAPDDALEAARSALVLAGIVPELRGEAERLVADLEALRAVRAETEGERDRLRGRLRDAADAEERLELLARTKREALEATGRDLEAERARAGELASRAMTLEELTAALDRDLADARTAAENARLAIERAAAEAASERERERLLAEQREREAEREATAAAADALRRAREDAERADPVDAPERAAPGDGIMAPGIFASADPAREAPAFAFPSLQSKLRLPVANGRVVRGATKGLVVAAEPGSPVRAPADGWVLYVGPFRSYGEIVIMNVGDDYRMVLAGLDSANVALGQFVLAGEPIGRVSGTPPAAALTGGAGAGPALYVELREGSATVDPTRWFAPEVADAGR